MGTRRQHRLSQSGRGSAGNAPEFLKKHLSALISRTREVTDGTNRERLWGWRLGSRLKPDSGCRDPANGLSRGPGLPRSAGHFRDLASGLSQGQRVSRGDSAVPTCLCPAFQVFRSPSLARRGRVQQRCICTGSFESAFPPSEACPHFAGVCGGVAGCHGQGPVSATAVRRPLQWERHTAQVLRAGVQVHMLKP